MCTYLFKLLLKIPPLVALCFGNSQIQRAVCLTHFYAPLLGSVEVKLCNPTVTADNLFHFLDSFDLLDQCCLT